MPWYLQWSFQTLLV